MEYYILWFNYGQKITFSQSCDNLPCGGMVWGSGGVVAPKNIFKKQKRTTPKKYSQKIKRGICHNVVANRGQTPPQVGLAHSNRTNGSWDKGG